jgi:hypothetical protein
VAHAGAAQEAAEAKLADAEGRAAAAQQEAALLREDNARPPAPDPAEVPDAA